MFSWILMSLMIFMSLIMTIQCQTIEKGWKEIRPLHSDKSAVDRILGPSKVDKNGYFDYSTEDAYIRVNYSTVPCRNNQYLRGKFSVPENTVLDYVVLWKNLTKLSELEFKREQYHKDTSGDVTNFISYINSKDGVAINVTVLGNEEFVRNIRFRPSKTDSEKFACVNVC